jgi:hypothetical protein
VSELVRVRFLQLPVATMLRSNAHTRELMREFALIELSDEQAKQGVRPRLVDVVERHRREFSTIHFNGFDQVARAAERGDPEIDMEMELPPAAGPAALEMRATLLEADEFCRRGELLTLAAPADLVEFREWFLGEVVRQIDGEPPIPWPDAAGVDRAS